MVKHSAKRREMMWRHRFWKFLCRYRVAFIAVIVYVFFGFAFGELYFQLDQSTGGHPPQSFTGGAQPEEWPPRMPHFAIGEDRILLLLQWAEQEHHAKDDVMATNPKFDEIHRQSTAQLEELKRELWAEVFGRSYFYYFSFVTLTTLGYGDVLPLSSLARSLVALEAVLGVLFLALFVGTAGAGIYMRLTDQTVRLAGGASASN